MQIEMLSQQGIRAMAAIEGDPPLSSSMPDMQNRMSVGAIRESPLWAR
jgi:hypothetical protein